MQHTEKIFTCSYLWFNMETSFVSKHSTDLSAKDTWKKFDILNNAFLKLSDCKLVTEQFLQGWNTFLHANATTKAERRFLTLAKITDLLSNIKCFTSTINKTNKF